MVKKHNLEDLKRFSYNPFLNYKSEKIFDESFINDLSNTARHLIKYLIYKQAFTEEKFLFRVNEFNRFMRYINIAHPSDGLAELCTKALLAKIKDGDVYWVNKALFNTGVFEPKHMVCVRTDEDSLIWYP
ncbi:hypothetical protein CE557_159 [Cardinium endosymbiont of Sogatella furcifera]|uniref:hypothetical protein n=1 Tax=Cardinium endosymbiont of Sogatella furcifera TaxID=650378 RepID=UPI000E0D9426|nr:hypothetical protein [Cardinium endosymbiont of Sogatella furcifera]AXI23997.1 hypothetical protein CE557_159 [Cardinium endosymbiont of Sogatella furcifera]